VLTKEYPKTFFVIFPAIAWNFKYFSYSYHTENQKIHYATDMQRISEYLFRYPVPVLGGIFV